MKIAARTLIATVLLAHSGVWAEPAQRDARVGAGSGVLPFRTTADDWLSDPVSPRARTARGLYFTGPFARTFGARAIISAVRRARLDAAVIDLKDDSGIVFYDSDIPELEMVERPIRGDTATFVRELREAGLYAIARIVCFTDPVLALREPHRAIQDNRPRRTGRPWISWGNGLAWLDPYNPQNQELVRRLAVDAAKLGFDEIQLDYVRFPVDDGVEFAHYPSEEPNTLRRHVIARMLARIDASVRIPVGVDVFGITTFQPGDRAGLGQSLEDWTPYVEVFTPMLYLNGHSSFRQKNRARGRAEAFVLVAVSRLRERIGFHHVVRPFLQAFAEGADYFDERFIAEQARGARQGNANGFLFWDPASSYRMVFSTTRRGARELRKFEDQVLPVLEARTTPHH